MATDIVSYGDKRRTSRVQRHIRSALYKIFERSFQQVGIGFDDCYREDRGDGMLIVVPPQVSSSILASELTEWLRAELRQYNELSSESARIRLRVAVHLGEVEADDHGLVGPAVIHLCRLLDAPAFKEAMASAEAPFAVISSDPFYNEIIRQASGLVDPDEYASIEVRAKETVAAAWLRIPDKRPEGRPSGRNDAPNRVSSPADDLVGREAELAELRALLADRRMVTLIGPGGVGKTRLAVEAVRLLQDARSLVCVDGVFIVDLTAFQRGDDLYKALLMSLPLAAGSLYGPSDLRPAKTALLDALRDRQVVLLLDNCEHLLDEISVVVETLLTHTDATSLIATSREVIGVSGETTLRVAPLAVPPETDSAAELDSFPAVRLFIERARAADLRFEPDLVEIARICRRLDGLPLALELAAARVRALTAQQIADLLDDRFRFLDGGSRATPRHRTLLSAVDWSYNLLDECTREIFSFLSVFRGGFQLEEAEQLGGRMGVAPSTTTETVIKLVDKSLLQAVQVDSGGKRYRMLETLREYATEKLDEYGRDAEVARHHAELYVDFAERHAPIPRPSDQPNAIRALEREDDNLRSAFEFGCRTERHELALRLIDALGWYIWMRGDRVFGWPGVVRTLHVRSDDQAPLQRARALIWSCHLGAVRTLEPEAREHGRQARRILESLGLTQGPDYSFCNLVEAFACYRADDYREGKIRIEQALQIADRLKDSWLLACSNLVSAIGRFAHGDFARAEPQLRLSAHHYRKARDHWGESRSLVWQSRLDEALGDLSGAERHAEQALDLVRSLGLVEAAAPILGWLAYLRLLNGNERAASDALRAVKNIRWWRTVPEAVAWVTQCAAIMTEQRAESAEHAARLHAEAAEHLTMVGLTAHALQSRCRQALLLAGCQENYRRALSAAARSASTHPDRRTAALVVDTSVVIAPADASSARHLALADALWDLCGAARPRWLATEVERVRARCRPDQTMLRPEHRDSLARSLLATWTDPEP